MFNVPLPYQQVIPSRLLDGQVVFLLPSHYVQVPPSEPATGEERTATTGQDVPLDFSVKREDELLPQIKQEVMDSKDDDVWRPW